MPDIFTWTTGCTQNKFLWHEDRNVTPYQMTVEDNIIHRIVNELEEKSAYRQRRQQMMRLIKKSHTKTWSCPDAGEVWYFFHSHFL